MKKNVSGQRISAMLVSSADGTPFTAAGPVSVFVTVDGTQAAGTQNGGNAVHLGNGEWSYAPSQAETDGDHIAFTFVATGAVPVCVQVYTTYPQSGDSFARLGSPAGASIAADIAAIEGGGAGLDAAGVRAALGMQAANMDTQLAGIAAIKAKTDNLPAQPAAVGSAMTLTVEYDFAKGSVAMPESYSAAGQPKTPMQALYELTQILTMHSINGQAWTVFRINGTTPAFALTLNNATTPTAVSRTS